MVVSEVDYKECVRSSTYIAAFVFPPFQQSEVLAICFPVKIMFLCTQRVHIQDQLSQLVRKGKGKKAKKRKVKRIKEQRKVEKYVNEKNLKYTGYEKELNYIEKKIKNELTRISKLENDSTQLSNNIIFLRNQEDKCKNDLFTIQEKRTEEKMNTIEE